MSLTTVFSQKNLKSNLKFIRFFISFLFRIKNYVLLTKKKLTSKIMSFISQSCVFLFTPVVESSHVTQSFNKNQSFDFASRLI